MKISVEPIIDELFSLHIAGSDIPVLIHAADQTADTVDSGPYLTSRDPDDDLAGPSDSAPQPYKV